MTSPYRASQPRPPGDGDGSCPRCRESVSRFATNCGGCQASLGRARCGTCFGVQRAGADTCVACQSPLLLEPELAPASHACPACRNALWTSPHLSRVRLECPSCGGAFVANEVLAAWLADAEAERGYIEAPSVSPTFGAVSYRPCPSCSSPMNRVNFGKVSGIIVDTCKAHGSWFDGGELTRALAFAASGGFERTRARIAQDTVDEKKRLAQAAAELAEVKPRSIFERRRAYEEMIAFSQKLSRLMRE